MMLVVLSLYDLFPPPNLQFSGDLRDQETTHHALKLGNFPAVSGGLKRDTVYKTRQFTSKRHSPWKCLTQRKHNGTWSEYQLDAVHSGRHWKSGRRLVTFMKLFANSLQTLTHRETQFVFEEAHYCLALELPC